MYCEITLGLLMAAKSVSAVPCSNFAQEARAAPRYQLASLETGSDLSRPPTPMGKMTPTATVSIAGKGRHGGVILVVETKEKMITTEVGKPYAHQFKALLTWLAERQYPIREVGGFRSSYIDPAYTGGAKILSEHAKDGGKALDINQCDRNKVGVCGGRNGRLIKAIPFPPGTNEAAHRFGLFPGAEWGSKDTGHFQVEKVIAEQHWPVVLTKQATLGRMMASTYGNDALTATGSIYEPNALTVAHKTLPIGTKLRVTNPVTGTSAIVTVNDRGPFVKGRELDLSTGAAKALHFSGLGVVDVERLSGSTREAKQ